MRFLALAFLALLAPAPPSISGITASSFGTGHGIGPEPILSVAWEASTFSLHEEIKSADGSMLPLIFQHYFLFGMSTLPSPFPLPAPNWPPGCELLILPDAAVGPLPFTSASIPVPPNPLLVGLTFYLQDFPQYAVPAAIPFFGVTQGVKLTFL